MEEKKGGLQPLMISMQEFNDCLNTCGLIHAPKTGLEFSWYNNRAGSKRIVCNLDRAVYNDKWLEVYPSWGYKNVPFRALKVWKSHSDFLPLIKDSWKEELAGNPGYVFMSKMKRLNKIIQEWNWNIFGDISKKLKKADETVMQATLISDKNPLDTVLLNNLVTTRGAQEILHEQQKQIIQQKSRVRWLKEGAFNTIFFHVNFKVRQAKNVIMELEQPNGSIVANQVEIANVLISYFEDKFRYQEVTYSPDFFQDIPKIVTEEDNLFLDAIPIEEEVKKAVFELDPDSSPGPDGFAGCIPIYNMYVYRWPQKVLKESERLIRNFLWTGDPATKKLITVNWDQYALLCMKVDWG
ncbi:uncharacterized protein LOC113359755 [Papaver somniferum]|uniref:uncharacterized protein LOC113359755 n=1 Tax=Papaver somniferum TaxID=3469 RepID=UPI000E6FC39D|nr:uncharacterized protein LOC113359755 [Papaver somniferum]